MPIREEDQLKFYADIDGITIVNNDSDLSFLSDNLVVKLILKHNSSTAGFSFGGILKAHYYGIHKLNTYEVIPFFNFGRYNVFLGWDVTTNVTSKTSFVADEDADLIVGLWVSATLKRLDTIHKCRNFIPAAAMPQNPNLPLSNCGWNAFKQEFHQAFAEVQMELPEKYRNEPQIIVQSYGEKELIQGRRVSTMAGDLSKLFSLQNVKYFWLTTAHNVSVANACGYWKRAWITDQLELSQQKDLQFFNQLGSHELANASWFNDVPIFLHDTVNKPNNLYDVTKVQCYGESIYCYDKIVGKHVDVFCNTPFTSTAVFEALNNIDCVKSRKLKFQLEKFKERLETQQDWSMYALICETLKELTYGARLEMTLFYDADEIEDFNWDDVDIDFKKISKEFKNYLVDKLIYDLRENDPVLFFPSNLIADYMFHIGNEINGWLTFFYQQFKQDANTITVPQMKLIHLLERMMSWLWKGDLRRVAYQTCNEINFTDRLAKFNHPVIIHNVTNSLREGCKVVIETKASYWKSILGLLPKDSSNPFTITVQQMLFWQLEFAKTCSKRSNYVTFFAKTLFNFWFSQVKLTIWKNTKLFKEISLALNFTAAEKETAQENFDQFFNVINQKLVCDSCFEKGSFRLLCSQSKKLKLNHSLSIEKVVSQVWSMSHDKISNFVLDQAISPILKTFDLEITEFKNSVNVILQDFFREKRVGVFYTTQSVGSINPFVWTSIDYHNGYSSSEASDLDVRNSDNEPTLKDLHRNTQMLFEEIQYASPRERELNLEHLRQSNCIQKRNLNTTEYSDKSQSSISQREQLIFLINQNIVKHCKGKYEELMRQCIISSFDSLSPIEHLILTTICKLPTRQYTLKHKAVMYEIVLYYVLEAPKKLIGQTRKGFSLNMKNSFIKEALGNKFFNIKEETKTNNKTDIVVPKIILTPKSIDQILKEHEQSIEKSHRSRLQKILPEEFNMSEILNLYEDNSNTAAAKSKKRKRVEKEDSDSDVVIDVDEEFYWSPY